MVTSIRKHSRGHLYIEEWLTAKGLSFEVIGNRLDVSRTTIWRWAKEQRRLNPEKIEALAEAMNMQSSRDLYRLPDAKDRPSIDALLSDAPDETYEAVYELTQKLTKKAS